MPKLKEILTDSAAIEAYKKDPFNPHAIARLRPAAFQKAIVMQYVDNLLDWGDALFAQDTMESINEATMLYVLAADILGKRPVTLGECETASDDDLTYEKIGPAIDKGSEFLVMLENWCYTTTWQLGVQQVQMAIESNVASKAAAASQSFMTDVVEAPLASIRAGTASSSHTSFSRSALLEQPAVQPFNAIVKEHAHQIVVDKSHQKVAAPPTKVTPAPHVVNQCTLVFCVPPNEELLKYWDRVEDRLFKIRNCMNISGVRRSLALFAPPINPMALVRAKAAGLSLEEALAALAAPCRPTGSRISSSGARQATQMVQSFGGALLERAGEEGRRGADAPALCARAGDPAHDAGRSRSSTSSEAQFNLQATLENETNVANRIGYYQRADRDAASPAGR